MVYSASRSCLLLTDCAAEESFLHILLLFYKILHIFTIILLSNDIINIPVKIEFSYFWIPLLFSSSFFFFTKYCSCMTCAFLCALTHSYKMIQIQFHQIITRLGFFSKTTSSKQSKNMALKVSLPSVRKFLVKCIYKVILKASKEFVIV